MSKGYQITLNKDWKRFVHSAPDGLELLGVVSDGAQVGALAMRADGSYFQLNGDWVTPLNASRVRRALGLLRLPQTGTVRHPVAPVLTPTASVQVTVRKRRSVVIPPPVGAKMLPP